MIARLKAFVSAHSRAVFMVFLAASVAAFALVRFPASRSFTYRYRHGLGVDLASAAVTFSRGGELARSATFRYNREPGKGPVSQDHEVRLGPGGYDAVFVLEYPDGGRREFKVPLTVSGFTFRYTVDVN
ncbi:MAG: hypothetical protein HY897_05010 [Deltaproteobacteria bacterium]|nr:hypothetical protein [Deltaproteobacteria bacterium]